MFEKVNPAHPDKIADRIAGAIVDLAYKAEKNPKIAVEVLIGHGVCHIIAETSVKLNKKDVKKAVKRIAGNVKVDFVQVAQDVHLAGNQNGAIRCGDNGIFKGINDFHIEFLGIFLGAFGNQIAEACQFDILRLCLVPGFPDIVYEPLIGQNLVCRAVEVQLSSFCLAPVSSG